MSMIKAAGCVSLAFALGIGIAGCASQAGVASLAGSGRGYQGSAQEPTRVPSTAPATSAAAPRVEDCGLVAISSPPKYACNGKVYTAFQLERLRTEAEKKYLSGR